MTDERTIAALYVDPRGCYAGLPGVEVWDEARDARKYDGPWPVVAHPPCQRWGVFAEVAFNRRIGIRGDDGGCFAAALAAVRKWGGVLEHPANSHAWRAHGIVGPRRGGGWYVAGDGIGWTCCVDQGAYGHITRKPTWLYSAGVELPSLRWGRRDPRPIRGGDAFLYLGKKQRIATPPEFRDVLIAMARSAYALRGAA